MQTDRYVIKEKKSRIKRKRLLFVKNKSTGQKQCLSFRNKALRRRKTKENKVKKRLFDMIIE
jgi:hypothetical protein